MEHAATCSQGVNDDAGCRVQQKSPGLTAVSGCNVQPERSSACSLTLALAAGGGRPAVFPGPVEISSLSTVSETMDMEEPQLVFTLTIPHLCPGDTKNPQFLHLEDTSNWRCLLQLLHWGQTLRPAAACKGSCRMVRSLWPQVCPELSAILQQGGEQLLKVATRPMLTVTWGGFPQSPFRYDPRMLSATVGVNTLDYPLFQHELKQIQNQLEEGQRPAKAILILWALQHMGLLPLPDSDELYTHETVAGLRSVFLISLRSNCESMLPHLTAASTEGLTHQAITILELPTHCSPQHHRHLRELIRSTVTRQLEDGTFGSN